MDCATVADGKLDECIELPGKQIEMSGKLSIVRTDPFTDPFGHPFTFTFTFMTFDANQRKLAAAEKLKVKP